MRAAIAFSSEAVTGSRQEKAGPKSGEFRGSGGNEQPPGVGRPVHAAPAVRWPRHQMRPLWNVRRRIFRGFRHRAEGSPSASFRTTLRRLFDI